MRFTQRYRGEILATALLTLTLIVVACLPGTGYQITTLDVDPRSPIGGGGVGDGRTVNWLFNGSIQVQFNRALYPISFLTGNENVFRKFQGAAEFWDYDGEQLKEAVTLGTLFVELIKNLPYFIATSTVAILLAMQISKVSVIKRLAARSQSQQAART